MQTESTGRYRSQLPQLQEQTFLTDGGLETDLISIGESTSRVLPAFHSSEQKKAEFIYENTSCRMSDLPGSISTGLCSRVSPGELIAIGRRDWEYPNQS